MKTRQLTARLVYASHLCSWGNVHPEMKPAVTGLLRRGFMERRKKDEALTLTSKGAEIIALEQKAGREPAALVARLMREAGDFFAEYHRRLEDCA